MGNLFTKHDGIILSKNKHYLQHIHGRPFFWFADTWWFGGTKRTTLDDFKTLVKDRKKKGFTVIQIVIGIPPEVDPFSEDAANSGGLPFNKDFTLNKKYFDEIDEKVNMLIKSDLVPCIVGGWGHHIDTLGVEQLKRLWDEIINRYGNLPVIFCLCGEVNITIPPIPQFLQTETRRKKLITFLKKYKLFTFAKNIKQTMQEHYFKKREEQQLRIRLKKWTEVAEYIMKNNKHNRPLTVHVAAETTAQQLFHNPSWLSLNTFQSGHGKDTIPFMVESIRNANKYTQPIINMEPWYEGILGNFDDYYQRVAFWLCILSGAKGHTYGAHGIWQMATTKDHFMNHWGGSDWKTALRFKGAEQLGNAVQFLKQYDWWKLEPVYDLVSPTWSKEQPWLPVSATIKDTFFVYLPDVQHIQSQLTIKKSLMNHHVIGLQPDTMNTIQIKNNGNTITIPQIQTKDVLLLISSRG